MWISKIFLNNFRSFVKESITLSPKINVFIGANNSGKSSVLNAMRFLEDSNALSSEDLRIGEEEGSIAIEFSGDTAGYFNVHLDQIKRLTINLVNLSIQLGKVNGKHEVISNASRPEPFNFIYPYLSKRKVEQIEEGYNRQNASMVVGTQRFLYSKINRIINPDCRPQNEYYLAKCKDILGIRITPIPSDKGTKAAYILYDDIFIPLDKMGEGALNILGLIVDLAKAKDKLFVIEEPENDIHPQALKKLLDLIIEKSANNQFMITTHSNIVMKYLSSNTENKLFYVSLKYDDNKLPLSKIEEVGDSHERRKEVLEELGYDLMDFDLWSGWLILEESSAEEIIRDYLIPWFTPELKSLLRTYSARSKDNVIPRFETFNDLFVFIYLNPIYRNKVWVVIDGGEDEKEIIEKLKEKYIKRGWKEEQFQQFKQHDFEKYYPNEFKGETEKIFGIQDQYERWEKKVELLNEVKKWIKEDEKKARDGFEKSAAEVIEILRKVESTLLGES